METKVGLRVFEISSTGIWQRHAKGNSTVLSPAGCLACRWFVLKDGKIFWFKTDIVNPVRRR